MVPELGQFALILALLMAVIQGVLPIIGAQLGKKAWIQIARPAAWGQCTFVVLSFVFLTWAFVVQDFSVAYVAQNSNSLLPLHYRFSAVWGAHEGSLLLWIVVLNLWTVAVARYSRSVPEPFVARVLGVMGLISVGFLLFTLFTSNPFLRHIPALADGVDLNPLLQDPGLIIHPPMLYAGYVGFAVAFAFAIAALIEGRVDSRWVRWSRPWTNVAWAFLTLGIALGSWWAYYELGWGGWWFWDPVENASFMPWLAGLALIHSQAATEKRGSFKSWTILLSIAAFSLSLLGTFIVRSGVLTSVHAFASDPARGLFILAFLAVVVGGALILYAIRAPRIATGAPFTAMSRETFLLLNNLFMGVATGMVLLGTLYPIIADAFNWGKISVGPPFFGAMFFVLMAPVVLLMPIAPSVHWRSDIAKTTLQRVLPLALVAIVLAAVPWTLWQQFSVRGFLGIAGALWIFALTGKYLYERQRASKRRMFGLPIMSRGVWGMVLAHLGVGVFLVGVTLVETRGIEKDILLQPGDRFEMNDYTFEFRGVGNYQGPNYLADRGEVAVYRNGDQVTTLYPEKRSYREVGQVMTEADIDPGLTRDVYVSLGEQVNEQGGWAVRIYFKPFIRWIWGGALMMMFGGFLAASDRRYLREAATARAQQGRAYDVAVAPA